MLRRLNKLYGNPETELHFSNSFELLISVMLSAQSTDKKVNQITPTLFKKYPSAIGMCKADVDTVKSIIREVNYHKTKAKHLVETCKILVEKHGGEIPKTHSELLELPGVGNKTANVVMSELKQGYAFPVDTHVYRVSKRLGLAFAKTRDKVEVELCEKFPKESWRELHHWLIFHGRRICLARNPKCEQCALSDVCPKNEF